MVNFTQSGERNEAEREQAAYDSADTDLVRPNLTAKSSALVTITAAVDGFLGQLMNVNSCPLP